MNKNVFDGLKVAEFAWVVVGPSTSRYLADHGATVVKIESHKRLDTNRINGPFVGGVPTADGSMFYGKHNPDKYCISIDLGSPGGKELAWKMIEWADIVTESFSPGTMEKWGMGYEDIKKVKPDVIFFSSSMQGRGGPHTSYAGYGQNAVNFSGFSEVTGWPDRLPSPPYGAYTDYVSCRFAAFAIMAALEYRRRTGKGQYIEQSQFESSIQFFSPPIMDYQINGKIMGRNGNRLPTAAPHGVYQCQGDDNWVAIAVMNDEQWIKFCEVIGNPALASDEKYSNLANRKKNEDTLDKLVTDWTLTHTAEEVEGTLQKAGIPSNVVEKPSDIYKDPQLEHRKYFTPLEHSVMGMQKYEAQGCFILSKTPRKITTPSPCVGEHNEYVFKELLKMSDDEIADHLIDGSITTEFVGRMTSSF
ncbi:MAG: CoA transferase [Dehalococcoidales bacterium]|nr:CoA transferase [Dehalococcoidales bacterium]